ncbi:hypothetical protein VTK73DRAFT_8046 [Phialemonium thermophilum]|uniref:Uncharacterized protein n=1 Tax=Phialemonium thermophilum TaxID=223376 RepID=A0ABR3WAS1_9PEZI
MVFAICTHQRHHLSFRLGLRAPLTKTGCTFLLHPTRTKPTSVSGRHLFFRGLPACVGCTFDTSLYLSIIH